MRLLLVEPHLIVRQSLRLLLERQNGTIPGPHAGEVGAKRSGSPGAGVFQVVGEAQTGREALAEAEKQHPDVVVTELTLPQLSGLDMARRLKRTSPQIRVIVLTTQHDYQSVAAALDLGVDAYLLKTDASAVLFEALDAVRRGKQYLSESLSLGHPSGFQNGAWQTAAESYGLAALTSREREILQLLAEGLCAKEVAAALDLSSKTVDAHRRRLMEKLGIRTVAELTRMAVREGLVGDFRPPPGKKADQGPKTEPFPDRKSRNDVLR